ncbi:MAG: hypothetical protein ACE5GQ_09450 [Nitrospinales bacterium]
MDHRTIFIVDPSKSDRIQLAKSIKHECFVILTFAALSDCFKAIGRISPHLIIYSVGKKKSDLKKLQTIKSKHKSIPFILYTAKGVPEVNLLELKEGGFSSIHKAGSQEKIKEIVYELVSPSGLPRRPETPHPVPITIDILLQPNSRG